MAFKSLLPEVWRGGRAINPWREMGRLQRRVDRMFDEFLSEPFGALFGPPRGIWEPQAAEEFPACDVEETKDHYLVSFDLPGVKRDDVKIELHDNMLTVSGERKHERKEEEKGQVSRERYYGAFTRSFTLPANVDAAKIQANYENGVLQLAITKPATAAGRQIPIKEGKLIEAKPGKAA